MGSLSILHWLVMLCIVGGLIYWAAKMPKETEHRRQDRKGPGSAPLITGAGIIGLILSFSMDTSVSTGYGRVNNIGLMRDQQNFIIVSGLVLIVGVLMLIFGNKQSKVSDDPFDNVDADHIRDRKQYAVDLGIRRENGRYVYGDHRFSNYEDAITYVEENRA